MNNQSHLIRLGFFVFLTISILVGLVFWFSWNTIESRKGLEVNVKFRNVKGLVRGADVRQNGVRVGTVNNVISDPEIGGARVYLGLYKGIKISNRSYYTINTGSLLGDASLDIYSCPTAAKELPKELTGDEESGCNENVPGGYLQNGATAIGIYEATPNLDDAVKELEGVIKQLRTTTLLGVNKILEEMNITMKDIGPKLSSTIGNIDQMTKELRESIKEITEKTDSVVANLDNTSSNMDQATEDLPDQIKSIVENANETISSLQNEIEGLSMNSRLNNIEKEINNVLDNISTITSELSEENFLEDVQDMAENINNATSSINETFSSINQIERKSNISIFHLDNESTQSKSLGSELEFQFFKNDWYLGLNQEWWNESQTNFFAGLKGRKVNLGAGRFRGETAAEISLDQNINFKTVAWWPENLDMNLKIKLGIPVSKSTNIVIGLEKIQNSEQTIFSGIQHNF